MHPVHFVPDKNDSSIKVIDTTESCSVRIRTSPEVSLCRSTPSYNEYADAAVTVETETLSFDSPTVTEVLNSDGDRIKDVGVGERLRITDSKQYTIGICSKIRLYLTFCSPFELRRTESNVSIEFPHRTETTIEARSYHRAPAATIEIPPNPESFATALPHLASSLKTFGPERSFPTVRGHPPAIEQSDDIYIPPEVGVPETGITIEVPYQYHDLLEVTPLVYYFGANVARGSKKRLVTQNKSYDLQTGRSAVEILKQCFLFDCVTRQYCGFEMNLVEATAVEETANIDFERISELPLDEQVNAYLSVPYNKIEEQIPTWSLAAHLPAQSDSVRAIPALLDEFSIIMPTDSGTTNSENHKHSSSRKYTHSDSSNISNQSSQEHIGDVIEDVWFGDSSPANGSRSPTEPFCSSEEDEIQQPTDPTIRVAVIVGSGDLGNESELVEFAYEQLDEFTNLEIYSSVTTSEMRKILQSNIDFLHYIGHVDDSGFRCSDGHIDVCSLEETSVQTFLLNGCESYHQGHELTRRGCNGGIVSIESVVDVDAVRFGAAIAWLLSYGFSLSTAMHITRRYTELSQSYTSIGDCQKQLAHHPSGVPNICHICSTTEKEHTVQFESFSTSGFEMGTIATSYIESESTEEEYYLSPGVSKKYTVTTDKLQQYLSEKPRPVIKDGDVLIGDSVEGAL